jgi:hypothetical protein
MKLPSTKALYRLLTCSYALGLFAVFLFGASGDIFAATAGSGVLILIPASLTVLLLAGQVSVAKREMVAAAIEHRSWTKPDHAWAWLLIVYAIATWLAVQLGNLHFTS